MIQKKLSILFLLITQLMLGQNSNYLQGYVKEVSGKRFSYHSPIPGKNASLLLRGQVEYEAIVWETELVPNNYQEEFVSLIWMFGMDVTADPVDFQLHINGEKWFDFRSSRTSDLGLKTFKGKEGASLILNVTMLDKYEDQMGFAILRLPTKAVELGKAVQLKISTPTEDNNAWFMTFKTRIQEQVNIYQNKVVAKSGGKLFHSISIDFIHIGKDEKATVGIGNITEEMNLSAGFNKMEINLPKVATATEFSAEIRIGEKESITKYFWLEPIKEWEIFLVQHTHTDIGYTRPQTEILPEHLRYIDHALDFCDQTDDYPDAAKFRWTCETSWSVREYLRSRPQAQIDRLIQRIKEGRIEATGMFLNFSEIIDESALAAQTKTLRMLKNKGIDVTTAMQNDVNGIAWCMVDYYHNTDVKYLTMGIHAHRARKPFDKPTSFWWQSPSGNRLLAYRSEHYQHANGLSLTTGQQDVFRNNLSQYLTGLEEKGYPYDKVSLQFSGYITDNSPPSAKACDIIKAWNEKYEWPKLRSALARDFMIYLDEEHAADIPEKEVAWPDWWTDGVGSAANETKVVRNTQARMNAITGALAMIRLWNLSLPEDVNDEIEDIYDKLLFYDEHTHGAAESVSDPLAQNTINQWGMKSAYAWEAAKKARALEEKALAFIEPVVEKSTSPQIAIVNTLNWKRSGMVELFIPFEVIPEGIDFTLTDDNGNEVPWQKYERRQEGAYYRLWVEFIPSMGMKTLEVNVGQKSKLSVPIHESPFENDFYKLEFDNKGGIIKQIYNKELGINLIDTKDTLTAGQLIYEELANRHEMERLTAGNRDTIYKPLNMCRNILRDVKIKSTQNGPIYKSVMLNGQLPVCADTRGVDIEIRLYHKQKKIEFLYRLFKLPVTNPEGVYVAFPFQLDQGRFAFEAQGGVVYPGINQLEGSSSDWNTIQNFAAVKNDNAQILLVSPDIPLVQFGAINTGRYYYQLKPKTNHIYSWVLNNYWVTNFKASQQGELRWKYAIATTANNSDIAATHFGWGERTPLLSRIIFPTEGAEKKKPLSYFCVDLESLSLLLVNARPSMDGKGVILQLREVENAHMVLDVPAILEETNAISIEEVNVLEERISVLTERLPIEHYATKFIKLNFEP